MRLLSAVSMYRPLAAALALGCLPLLAGCMDGGSDAGAAPKAEAAPKPDYATHTGHFAELQKAGLTGDYAAFARHLKPADPAAVTSQLQRSFGGRPFDVYTRKSDVSDAAHRRLVELRSATGRLYLYLRLDRVTGGWKVATYELGRDESSISAKL
jgi:hypothetical protein